MQYTKIIIHHSACPSINGKGYDYKIMKDGMILSSPEPYEPYCFHLCLEGDFNSIYANVNENREQLFMFQKLLLRLFRVADLSSNQVFAHSDTCPGEQFPWQELVILPADGYH
jgi:hypothetical protein